MILPEGWHCLGPEAYPLAEELAREVGPDHPLSGVPVVPVARRHDRDDVLFLLPEAGGRLAEVHLTWSGRREADARWPSTVLYESWQEWQQASISDE